MWYLLTKIFLAADGMDADITIWAGVDPLTPVLGINSNQAGKCASCLDEMKTCLSYFQMALGATLHSTRGR